jgi:N-acetylglucosamine-6-phosphate deacetylase
VIPGLVDVHFHGCVGEDFSDATPEGLQRIADYELSQGVTYICPAGMTLPEDQLTAICKNVAAHRAKNAGGAEVVGAHLEGPFLSTAKKGAQNGDFLRDPDIAMLQRLQEAAEGCVKLVTVAPEQPGAMEFIKAAKAMGITVSVGHTVADYDTAMEAFRSGATHATHLYNGMPPIHHRAPGVIGAAFDAPGVRAEIICEKQSHKQIIIGKGGEVLKKVGMYSREELEKLTGSKIFLDLWVRVKENWREREGLVSNFGYNKKDIDQ